eukprot:TRINITY_DN4771_c0_g1_i1.p1 TRINITY_DN4771_c0_g1~~TRINITY_DN4771_c0_g1_i1.p1  ORF type:complete len:184 (-),score=42.39 TRINITY_DN4771_c0_g1_i1:800-1351(-)
MIARSIRRFSSLAAPLRTAIYAGSFDPPSVGHLDIIERSLNIVDKLIVGVAINPAKKYCFTVDKRKEFLRKITSPFGERAEIEEISGLVIKFAKEKNVSLLIRGIRSHADLDAEIAMAYTNKRISGVDTLFLLAREEHVHVASSTIRVLASHETRLPNFVPEEIEEEVYDGLFKIYHKNCANQ